MTRMAEGTPEAMRFTIYIDPDGSVTITDLVEDLLPLADALADLPPGLRSRARQIARRNEERDGPAGGMKGRADDE